MTVRRSLPVHNATGTHPSSQQQQLLIPGRGRPGFAINLVGVTHQAHSNWGVRDSGKNWEVYKWIGRHLLFFLKFLFYVSVRWKPSRSVRTIAEPWDIGYGGGGQWSWKKWMSPGQSQNPGQEVSHQCEQLLRHIPPAGGGRLLSGEQLEVASVPVDDVRQARIT